MSPVLKRVVAAVVPCLLLLSGCGIAGTQFHPGVAARVGDETITNDRVDELTTNYCSAIEKQVTAGGQSLPLTGLKTAITAQLAIQTAAEQIADQYGVEPGTDYKSQLVQFKQQADSAGYEGEARDAYITVQSTQALYTDLLTQVGAILLSQEGTDDAGIDFQQARGLDELASFVDAEGMTFDPRYGLTVADGLPKPADTDITYAEGDLAKQGQGLATSDTPDPNYVAALPLSSTCG